jgi:hypothetical protein
MSDKSWVFKNHSTTPRGFQNVGGVLNQDQSMHPGFFLVVDVLYLRHGDEHGPLLILLADIGQPAEDKHPHDYHQHKQPQLLVAAHRHLRQDFLYLKGLGHEVNGIFLLMTYCICRLVDLGINEGRGRFNFFRCSLLRRLSCMSPMEFLKQMECVQKTKC